MQQAREWRYRKRRHTLRKTTTMTSVTQQQTRQERLERRGEATNNNNPIKRDKWRKPLQKKLEAPNSSNHKPMGKIRTQWKIQTSYTNSPKEENGRERQWRRREKYRTPTAPKGDWKRKTVEKKRTTVNNNYTRASKTRTLKKRSQSWAAAKAIPPTLSWT